MDDHFDNDAEPLSSIRLQIRCSQQMYEAYTLEAKRRQLSHEGLLEVLWNLSALRGEVPKVRMRRRRPR